MKESLKELEKRIKKIADRLSRQLIYYHQFISRISRIKNLKGKAAIVGGVVMDGYTYRDIDIMVSDLSDIPKIKKALGPYAQFAHFLPFQRKGPTFLVFGYWGKKK